MRSSISRELDRYGGDRIPERSEILASVHCPFPLRINPLADAAERASLDWLAMFRLVDPWRLPLLARAHLTTLVAGFYPCAEIEKLQVASDYLFWAFVLDDLGDETEIGARPARLIDLFGPLEEVLDGIRPAAGASPLERGLHDVLQRLSRFASPRQLVEFIDGNRAYFRAMVWEAENRANAWVPDETAYLALRPAAGAVPSFFALIEPLEGVTLRPEVRGHPQVRALSELAGKIICCTNDLLSYEKERALGDCHNLVVVYECHRGITPREATHQAIDFVNATTRTFIEGTANLPAFDAHQVGQVRRYADILRSVIRVTLHWTHHSSRYSGSRCS